MLAFAGFSILIALGVMFLFGSIMLLDEHTVLTLLAKEDPVMLAKLEQYKRKLK